MKADVKQLLGSRWERIRSARDQLKLEMNLAKLEAKKRLRRLGSLMDDAQKLAADVGHVSKRAVGEIAQKVSEFRNAPRRDEEPPAA